jgi:hypothetical protein
MDFCMVRNDHHGAKFGLAEHALERQPEVPLYFHGRQEGFGGQIDQSPSGYECWISGDLQHRQGQRKIKTSKSGGQC